jgi:hypothetical protein
MPTNILQSRYRQQNRSSPLYLRSRCLMHWILQSWRPLRLPALMLLQ